MPPSRLQACSSSCNAHLAGPRDGGERHARLYGYPVLQYVQDVGLLQDDHREERAQQNLAEGREGAAAIPGLHQPKARERVERLTGWCARSARAGGPGRPRAASCSKTCLTRARRTWGNCALDRAAYIVL